MKKHMGRRTVALVMAMVFSFTSIVYSGHLSQAEDSAPGIEQLEEQQPAGEDLSEEEQQPVEEDLSEEEQQPIGQELFEGETGMQYSVGAPVVLAAGDPEGGASTTTTEYTITVSGGDGAFFYKPADGATYTKITGGSVPLTAGSTYSIRYEGSAQKLVAVAAKDAAGNLIKDAASNPIGTIRLDDPTDVNASWKQCWEATITLSANVSFTASESDVSLSLQGQGAGKIIPDLEYTLKLGAQSEGTWDLTKLPEYTLKMSEESDQITLQKDSAVWKLKYHANKEPILTAITVDVYDSARLGVASATPDPDFSKTFDVLNTGLIYGQDFEIADSEDMYAAQVDNQLNIYHNGTAKNIYLYKTTRYNAYRYHFGTAAYPDTFTSFGENENSQSLQLSDDSLYLQMKNTDASSPAFGSSGEIKVVSDTAAPGIEVYKNNELQDVSVTIKLNKTDVLTVKAVEPDSGSGVAKITQQNGETEEELTTAEGKQTSLSSPSIYYTEDSTAFTVYAYDNVGNKKELTIQVSVDTTLPVITQEKGRNAYTYEGDAKYYVNSDAVEAVAVTYQDAHLDSDSMWVSGPATMLEKPSYEEGEPYTIGYKATGTGTVTFGVKDTYGNSAETVQAQVVLDTVSPVVNEGTVKVTDVDTSRAAQAYRVNSPYGTLYDAEAFHEPLLSFQVTEENLLKIEVEVGGQVIELAPNTPQGNTYTYTNVPLGEVAAFAKGNITIKVYDKVMHETVYTYRNDCEGKVTYVKQPTTLGIPEVTSALLEREGRTYVITDHGRMDMKLHISSELFIPELLELRLMRVAPDGSRTQMASYRNQGERTFTVFGSGGEWNVLFDYTFDGTQDGAYIIEAYYTDIALNEIISTESDRMYYIDETPVTLSVSSMQVSKGGRTNQPVQVVYTMTEENPDFTAFTYDYSSEIHSTKSNVVNVTIVRPDGTRQVAAISELTAMLNDASAWKQQDDVYTLTLEYSQQSRYKTKLTVQDIMGNAASADYDFKLDTEAPGVTSVDIKTEYENKNNTEYKKFDSSTASITVKLREEIVSTDDISVTCKAKDDVTGEEKQLTPLTSTKDGNVFTYTFSLKKDFKGSISFVTSDGLNAGDSTGVNIANGIILEGKDQHQLTSARSITENSTPNENGFYRRAVSLKFTAQDSYSGIRTVEYGLTGKKTTEDFSKQTVIQTNWEKTPVSIEATKENEGNDVKTVLTVVDNAGHKDTIEKPLKIDITKPNISVSYDNNSVQNDKYYRADRTATITIKELNYDARTTSVVVYKDGEPIEKKPTFHSDGKVQKAEDGTQYKEYEMKLAFTEDGVYTFQVETTDLAGNKGTYVLKSEFVIDKTTPKLTLQFDNHAPFKEQCFGEGRTATITVTEHNFDPAGIVATTTATRDGVLVDAPTLGSFTSEGDVHTAQIVFRNEAEYSISVVGTDLAGNMSDATTDQTFTVDLTAPEIVITGISEGSSYNREVRPVVTVTDSNYDTEAVSIEIIGGRNGEVKDITPVRTQTAGGYSYTYPDLKYVQNYDDCYVIKATAVDKGGHEAEAVMNYRVNRFGSTYILNDALQSMVDNYYGHASDEYAIIETNVDQLREYKLSYTLDGEITSLKEGVDYSVVASEDDGNWNQYEYRLNAAVFEREGVYAITIASKDAAGNVTDNKAKDTVIEFCIDNTAPSCIISGVSEGQRFEKDETVSIGVEVYDNTKLAQVSVMLNGTQLYTEEDLVDGKITDIPIDRTVKNQTLTIVSYDAAGNERKEIRHFTCQVSVFDMPVWLWAGIAAAGILMFGAIMIIVKRRKNSKSV